MRKVLVLVNQFPVDLYTEEEAWQTFVKECYAYKNEPEKDFCIQTEKDDTGHWRYVYRIEPIEYLYRS